MIYLSVLILAGVWIASLLFAYQKGKSDGWQEGHQDTKGATFEVLDKKK